MFYIEAIPFVTDIKLENSEPLTGFRDFKRYRKVNGDHYITFYIFKDNTNSAAFDLLIEESIVSVDENEYRIKNCENSVTKGGVPFKFVNATHTFFDLRDEKYVYDSVTNTQSLQQIASFIFKDTKYTPVVLADVPSRVFESFGDGNAIALLNKALNVFGVEFEVYGTQVIFRNQIGTKGDFQLRRKHNIKNIKETRDTFGLSTYIKGFGKDGLTAEYTSPMAAVFGKRHAQPVRDERFEIKENLLEEMKRRLQDTPIITIEIDFVDLKKLGYLYDTISLGDSVFVIHEVLGIDYEARVVEYIDYPYEQTKGSSVVISNIRKDFTSSMADMQSTKTTVDDLIANGIPNKMLNESIVRASKAINDSMTELEYPESGGIIARSKVNPNHVVRMTSAGIGVSSDGGKTYKTAMTGEGLVAELIRGGVITGSTLRTDNGSNYVHIEKQFIRLMESNLTRLFLGYYYTDNGVQPTILLHENVDKDHFNDGTMVVAQQNLGTYHSATVGITKGYGSDNKPYYPSILSLYDDGDATLVGDNITTVTGKKGTKLSNVSGRAVIDSGDGISQYARNGSYLVEATAGIAFTTTSSSFWVEAPEATFKCQVRTKGINVFDNAPDSTGTIKYMNGFKGWGFYGHIGAQGWAYINIS